MKDYEKPGFFEPRKVKKGVEETSLNIKEGGTYWWVSDGQGGGYDVERELDAIMLSKLVKIEAMLKASNKNSGINIGFWGEL